MRRGGIYKRVDYYGKEYGHEKRNKVIEGYGLWSM